MRGSLRSLPASLTVRVAGALLALALVALLILGAGLHLSGRLEEDGMVVDLAGSERMRAYKLSTLAHTLTRGPERRSLLEEEMRRFEAILAGLRDGSSELRLPAAPTPEILAHVDTARAQWQTVMKPALRAALEAASIEEARRNVAVYETGLPEFIGSMDGIVKGLVTHSSRKVEDFRRIESLLFVLLLVVAGGTGVLLHRFVVRPLLEVGAAARAMSEGDLSRRARVMPSPFIPREVDGLTKAFNEMGARIETSHDQLRLLHEAARAITAERDVEPLLQRLVETTRELLGAGYGALGLFGDDGRVRQFLTAGLTPEARERIAALPEGRGLLGHVFKHGQTLRLDDLAAHPAAVGFPPGHPPMRSLLAVPIRFRQQILGALYLTEKPGGFTAEDEALLVTLSADAAVALENARLLDETRTQQTRLAQIFDSTSDGIILVSGAGEIQAVNRQAGALLGFNARAAVVGIGLAKLLARYRKSVADYDRVLAGLSALAADPDRGGEGDLELRRMGRIIHWVGQPTKDAAGRTVGLTLTLRDVTQERQVSQMKTDFVAFVTHQLRTPLAGIKWMLELAQQESGIPEEPLTCIQDARQAAERLIGLVNDLLNVSQLESGKLKVTPQPVSLGELTQSVLDDLVTLVREKGHRLSVEGADHIPPVMADPQLLRQVILNLTSNAIKYTPAGGEVAIRTGVEDGAVRWAITDSGIGIPTASQARLFEKFYRADNAHTLETEGTGLGLYLVRLILEKFSGQVWCESEEGRGATFIFTLPVSGRGQ